MALFGLLWLMRLRSDARRVPPMGRTAPGAAAAPVAGVSAAAAAATACHLCPYGDSPSVSPDAGSPLLPPPTRFADDDIPPPPPPPVMRRRLHHHHHRAPSPPPRSRSVYNLPTSVERCTCPSVARQPLRPCVRFHDERPSVHRPPAESWNLASILTTLPRNRSSYIFYLFF